MIDKEDAEILRILQSDARRASKRIASQIGIPISTVYAKTRRMEELGIIKGYKAILDGKKLGKGAAAFVLISFANIEISQREVAKRIARFPDVQEVHIISGDWDIMLKVKGEDVEAIGRFVVNELRDVKGVQKTLTCMVFDAVKETQDIAVGNF